MSVALSADGNTVIVGGDDDNFTGASWIFVRDALGNWKQQGNKLVGAGASSYASQGSCVAMSADGNTVIIGADNDFNELGAAWIFVRSAGVWSQQGNKLIRNGTYSASTLYHYQGLSVAISADGNTALIGGTGYGNPGDLQGVWIFNRSGGVWTQQANRLVGTGFTGSGYGYNGDPMQGSAVAISADGNTILESGIGDNSNQGAIWVFTNKNGAWTQQGNKMVGTGNVGAAMQGIAIALSADGNNIIVGGYADNANQGAAWIFTSSTVSSAPSIDILNPTISITTPSPQICSSTATFTSTITNGGGAPIYQWKKNGADVGTNSSTYTDAQLKNNDSIFCRLTSNSPCASTFTAISDTIVIHVNVTVSPSISIKSSSNNICAGTFITFNATATNSGSSPIYQWKKNGVNVGTNSSTYTDASLKNNDSIFCVLTSNATCASITTTFSDTVIMSVNATVTPLVSVKSSSNNICAGTSVTFTANATNSGISPVYQWKKNGANVGNNSATYTDAALINKDTIFCILTSNALCAFITTAFSDTVIMTVNPVVSPTISIKSSATNICSGTSVTFIATVINGGTLPVYQWKKNGVNVGNNSSTYFDALLNNNDNILCTLTSNAACVSIATVTSGTVIMTVNPIVSPSISIVASTNNICQNTSVTFTATTINGGTNPNYQWKINGINMGGNSNSYTSSNLANSDVVTCEIITNGNCLTKTATSNSITITVNPLVKATISVIHSPDPICPGARVTFTAVTTNGGLSPRYQWQKNGANVGTNSPTYIDNSIINGTKINCNLYTSMNCATPLEVGDGQVMATVKNLPGPVDLGANTAICEGNSILLDAKKGYVSYEWQDNSTNQTFVASAAGLYFVTAKDSCGTNFSDTIIVSLNPLPSNFLFSDTAICSYETITLKANQTFDQYVWSDNSSTSSTTIGSPGLYWLQATDQNSCVGRDSILVTLKDCIKGFYAPTIFSPNGDGKNDVFSPLLYGNVSQYQLTVYNRYGSRIFTTKDITSGWDGKINGLAQGANTYVWVCTYQFAGEAGKTEKGTVVLVR